MKTDYGLLMRQFVNREISVEKFRDSYLTFFQSETSFFDDELFDLLDGVFADVESYTTDVSLLNLNPDYYIGENSLRETVAEASKLYALLQHNGDEQRK